MLNFGGITHIQRNTYDKRPAGYNFYLVGAVPVSMLEGRKPTPNDMMAGRVKSDGLAYHGRKWETVEVIIEEASKHPEVTLCSNPTCACRSVFTVPVTEVKA